MSTAVGLQRSLRVLASTENGAATDALLAALQSEVVGIRTGAARALVVRRGENDHRQLLLALAGCKADVSQALADESVLKRLRPALTAAIKSPDKSMCQSACRFAIEVEEHRVLPTIAEAAIDSSHPFQLGFCSACLQLARSLSAWIEARQQGIDDRRDDPAFVRRPALQSLGQAIDRYAAHGRLELIDAFLMITTSGDPMLRRILRDETHAAREPVVEGLMTSRGYGAMDVLVGAMEDVDEQQWLLELAATRCDRPYVQRLLTRVGERPGVRAIENARRLTQFGWTDPARIDLLLSLDGSQQAAAMRLLSAADSGPEKRIELARVLLRKGRDAGRVAACEALRRVQSPEMTELLEIALKDTWPDVVAMAASQLRRHDFPDALTQLVLLLDHESDVVRTTAQQAMGEFSFASYREIYKRLEPAKRAAAGRLVGKADPEALASVSKDLASPIAKRRLAALDLIDEMGLVDRLLDQVISALEDRDVGVRAEAARVLGDSENQQAVEALARILHDKSQRVRLATEESLQRMDSLEVAEQLVVELEDEFDIPEGQGNELKGPAS